MPVLQSRAPSEAPSEASSPSEVPLTDVVTTLADTSDVALTDVAATLVDTDVAVTPVGTSTVAFADVDVALIDASTVALADTSAVAPADTPTVALADVTATGAPVDTSAVTFANVDVALTNACAIGASAVAFVIAATPPVSLVFRDSQSVINGVAAALLSLAQGVRAHATVKELTPSTDTPTAAFADAAVAPCDTSTIVFRTILTRCESGDTRTLCTPSRRTRSDRHRRGKSTICRRRRVNNTAGAYAPHTAYLGRDRRRRHSLTRHVHLRDALARIAVDEGDQKSVADGGAHATAGASALHAAGVDSPTPNSAFEAAR